MSRSPEECTAVEPLPPTVAAVLDDRPERRRAYVCLLGTLRENGGRCSAAALAAALARADDGAARRSAYLAVRREYVPTLAALGVVSYDGEDGTVTLRAE
ncbi:DUF7344 domain-containing protein [Halosegnis marinus]|uniref:DUF7344 domain-containing protein n=1 Tax=Halosegnis marinus TaxID=3034023 RepID=A0ABD5ZS36_9EURY|nr:hypothetical protein [Halosegnis sp. DT85]